MAGSAAWLTLLGTGTSIGLAARWLPLWTRLWKAPGRLAADRARERDGASLPARRPAADRLRMVFIVPAYEETEALPRTVAALAASADASRYRAEIVIVTSTHETRRARAAQPARELVTVAAGAKARAGHGAAGAGAPSGHGARDGATGWEAGDAPVCTRDVAEALSDRHPQVICLEDDTEVPSMAAQFNTGMAYAAAKYAGAEATTYVVCYNADTTAAPDSVEALGDSLVAAELPRAAQLMCVSLRNLDDVRGPAAWYLLGAAYYQTRWALGFEFDMYRRSTRQPWSGRAYYFRGHGITLRLDTATELGGLSTETALEDLLLGFRLSLRDVPVAAVPTLEATETPTTFRTLIVQKRHWFGGMWDALRYRQLMPAEYAARPARFRRLQLRSLYRDVGSWLLGPAVVAFTLFAAGYANQPWLTVLPLLNAVLTMWLVGRAVRSHRLPTAGSRPLALIGLPLGVLGYSLTRNLGPLAYLARRLRENAWR